MKQKVGFGETIVFLHRICSAMGKKQKVYWLGSFLGAMEILNTILIPFVFQKMIQMVSDPGSSSFKDIMMVILLLGAVLFVTPVISLGSYLQHESVIVGKNIIRKRLFAHVQRLPVTDIQKRDTGEYMVLLSSDVDRAYGLLQGHGMRSCYQFLVVLPVTAGILLYYSPYVAAAAIPVSLAAIWFSAIFNPRVSRLGKEALKEMGASAGPLTELVCGSSMVRIFSGYPWILQKFSQICRRIFRKRVYYRTMNGIVDAFLNFFQAAAQPFTFIIGLTLIISGKCDLATAVLVSGIASVLADSSRGVGTFIANIQPPLESARRIFELLDIPEEKSAPAAYPSLETGVDPQSGTAISIRNLSFSYSEDKQILQDFSCDIKAGQIVTLTGPSGCGKTTLFRLLQAMYAPESGEIYYFGIPAKSLSRWQIREMISYVPQECNMFEGSIAYNIQLGNPKAGMEDIILASQRACIDDYIKSLPDGYDTDVGEKGTKLSGGQRQRIAIARAFLKDAPILLLDEPTSALDAEAENEIWKTLEILMKGRTVLIITHQQRVMGEHNIQWMK